MKEDFTATPGQTAPGQTAPGQASFVFAVPAIVPTKIDTHFLGYIITEEAEATVRIYVEPLYPERWDGEERKESNE